LKQKKEDGVKDAATEQEKIRGLLYENYVEDIQQKIKSGPDLEFLKTYQTKTEIFRHSGLSVKAGLIPKQINTNSIVQAPKKTGFGNPTVILDKPAVNNLRYSSSTPAIKNVHLMDPRKAAALYVRQACIEYSSIIKPTQSEKALKKSSSLEQQIEEQNMMHDEGIQTLNNPRSGSPSTSMLKVDQLEAEASQKTKDFKSKEDNRFQSRPMSPDIGARPSTAASHGILVRKFNNKQLNHQYRAGFKTSKPSSAVTRTTAAPSATEIDEIQQAEERRARVLKARKGVEQFDFKLPEENMVEIRCMLHPTIPRTWKQPIDAWFPGMRTKMSEATAPTGVNTRKVEQKEYYKSKVFQYDEEAVQEARSKPIVRCASKYVDPDRLARQKQLENDRLIINKKVLHEGDKSKEKVVTVPFYTLFPYQTSLPKSDYANRGEDYRPVSAHKFRDKSKSNWVSNRDFTVF
jgi:hypothetical protein